MAYLRGKDVRLLISTMPSRHNLARYEEAGLRWHHVPVASCAEGADALEELLGLLKRELRGPGAVAIHANRRTDFVAAVCAAHLHAARAVDPRIGLEAAAAAGLDVTPDATRLLGVDYEELQPRARIAASTPSGRSVTT